MENTKGKMKIAGKIILAFALIFVIALVSASHLPTQCNDGADNDGDGNTDYSADTGCSSATDNSEDIVLGYAHGCLTNGDKLYDVFGNVQYSCTHTSCSVCVLMAESGNYSANPSRCNGLTQCGFGNGSGSGGGSIDSLAPNLTIKNPIEGNIYNSTRIKLELNASEKADIHYRDLDDSSSRWNSVCNDCKTYNRERVFDEGENNLQFRVRDSSGNSAYYNLSFTTDSKDPRIKSVSPTSGFVSSIFTVKIEEENPTSLIMHFGNDDLGFGNETFDLTNDCVADTNRPEKMTCSKDVDLGSYDGTDVDFWFTLTDIANNSVNSQTHTVSVDETAPVVNNVDVFYEFDFKHGKVDFSLNITELNFDEAGYIITSDFQQTERRLCTRLENGICEKSVSFNDGYYNVTVFVRDKAGNEWTTDLSFLMDKHSPKITGIEPKSGFANGNFEVQFREVNPETVTLYYGNLSKELSLEDDCFTNPGDRYVCSTTVDLDAFDGSTVGYHFIVEDKVGNSDESAHKELNVDTTFPVVNNPDSFFTVDGSYVSFSLSITEDNFDETTYSYLDTQGRLVERRICSRLNSAGFCEKRVSFRSGTHNLTVNVIDDASNKVGLPANFVI